MSSACQVLLFSEQACRSSSGLYSPIAQSHRSQNAPRQTNDACDRIYARSARAWSSTHTAEAERCLSYLLR
ncbi:hypothetical protein CALVIDRAFT_437227 [Calocera viscosa TUFC12733]|uniref:Uncharacterized protein n=1 Tax=Calocera viscosa (strain TUFC12733) TaxID=1330018 RepID=A0A167FUH1_CALVF|nr:hypothetical protein CALVIDRAFT_437227 [Calocera viscosa TUFC12733]